MCEVGVGGVASADGGASVATVTARHAAVRRALLANIEESAYVEPTAIQMQAVPAMCAGRDVLAIAPTGSGKTAAFALPLLLLLQGHDAAAAGGGPRAIVLTPVRELAHQTARELTRLAAGLGVRVTVLSKATASGAAGGTVSVGADARDLVHAHHSSGGAAGGAGRAGRVAATDADEDDEDDDEVEASGDDEGLTDEEEDEANSEEDGGASESSGSAALDDRGGARSTPPASGEGVPVVVVPALPRCDILVTTPLILVAALRHAVAASGAPGAKAVLLSLRALVCDEADKLLELDFLEQVDEILAARPTPELAAAAAAARGGAPAAVNNVHVQHALVTATMPGGIEELARVVLRDPLRVSVGTRDAASSTVSQRLLFAGREDGKLHAMRTLLRDGVRPPVLVFTQSKERAVELTTALRLEGVNVDAIHADKSPAAREELVRRFRRGELWVLITTDLLARGMDFPAVRLVINYDFPQSAVSYVHRVGRTGRGGRAGEAVTLFTEDDFPALRSIANVMTLSGCAVPDWMLTLKPMSRRDKKHLATHAPDRRPIYRASTKFDRRQAAAARGGAGGGGSGGGGGGGGGGKRRRHGSSVDAAVLSAAREA